MKPGESVVSPLRLIVTPGYLQTMNMALVRGRYFDERDTENSPRVVMVDERLAKKFWPNQDPIGRRMYQPSSPNLTAVDENTKWLRVVGVVRNVRQQDLSGAGNQSGTYYFPFAQAPERSYVFAVATNNATTSIAPAVRAAIARVDPSLALFEVETMQQRKELSLSSRQSAMSLALAFGALALFLSALGIYSVLSYLVGQRRREIGIRLAVGCSPSGIFQLFLREGLLLVVCGLALGLIGAAAMRKAVETQIYGVRPLDPLVLTMVIAVLGVVALAACLRPAQVATKVDPVTVLNEQ